MALACGGRHRKQRHEYAIHMVPFLAPISRHHAQPIFITPTSLTMHRPASIVPRRVKGGVEDWKGATRHVLHLICASLHHRSPQGLRSLSASTPLCAAYEGRSAPPRYLGRPPFPHWRDPFRAPAMADDCSLALAARSPPGVKKAFVMAHPPPSEFFERGSSAPFGVVPG